MSAKLYKDKVKKFEDKYIQKEWENCKDFTLLENEKSTKAFLNIESRKMGYKEIDTLTIYNPNNPNTKIENTDQKLSEIILNPSSRKITMSNIRLHKHKMTLKTFF